jgi:hypothetical protein
MVTGQIKCFKIIQVYLGILNISSLKKADVRKEQSIPLDAKKS